MYRRFQNYDEAEFEEVNLEEIEEMIKSLPNGKAAGVDEVPNELIKKGGKTLVVLIYDLI